MKVHLFNHWFKYKVPVDRHWPAIQDKVLADEYINVWDWLNDLYDVGQFFKVSENRNYMVFHNQKHYINCLLKWP